MTQEEYRNKILATLDYNKFYESILENTTYSDNEIKAECPFKELHTGGTDNTPSFTVNTSTGAYICKTCHSKGNAHTMYKILNKCTSNEAWLNLGDMLNITIPNKTSKPQIESDLVAKYHLELMKLIELDDVIKDILFNKRGLSLQSVTEYQLGWDGERVTIPIYDEFNTLINFRCYKWNSDNDKYKMINYKDSNGNKFGEVAIFGIDSLINSEQVIWCEGEWDRILAEQHGFSAACPTSGAGTWRVEWSKYFKGKKVIICMDNDEAGRIATDKLCHQLHHIADVSILKWDEGFSEKGDITDFFTSGKTSEDFQALIDNASNLVDTAVEDEEVIQVNLYSATDSKYKNKKLEIPVMVAGVTDKPCICPSKIKFQCTLDTKLCGFCGMAKYGGEYTAELDTRHNIMIALINCTDKQQQANIRDYFEIPVRCMSYNTTILENTNISEIRLIPKAESKFVKVNENTYVSRMGYFLGHIRANMKYNILGHMQSSPLTQEATFLLNEAIPDKNLATDFQMTEDIYKQLQIFQPNEGQTVKEKIDEIHTDFEHNVTSIWQRKSVAIATDMIYHTVLSFIFQGQPVVRGWGELLIIGDSGQAKTTLVERLMEHYNLGEIFSGESSSRTGLLYSQQKMGDRWMTIWGGLPLNNGKLAVIDEFSGMKPDDVDTLTSARSAGIIKVTGVNPAETSCKVRIIFLTNPADGKQLKSQTFGVSCISKVFKKSEDIRRLDMAVGVASGEVSEDIINKFVDTTDNVEHTYTTELCQLRVLWAWSRTPDQIIIGQEATKFILEKASEMGKQYSSAIPLVEPADQRLKIARLSIAVACMMFSTTDGENVIVKKEHVEFVVDFLNEIYNSKALQYGKMSQQDIQNNDDSEENIARIRLEFTKVHMTVPHMIVIRALERLTYFSDNVFMGNTGLTSSEINVVFTFLNSNHLIKNFNNTYHKEPILVTFVDSVLANPITDEEIRQNLKLNRKTEGMKY